MGNTVIRPTKPNRLNVWGARASSYDWQYWWLRFKDFRLVYVFIAMYVWENPGRLRMLEWSRSQSEFDKKQDEYEKIKFYERHRERNYDLRDQRNGMRMSLTDKDEQGNSKRVKFSEYRELDKSKVTDQRFGEVYNDLFGISKTAVDEYYQSKWKAQDILSGKMDEEIQKEIKAGKGKEEKDLAKREQLIKAKKENS